MIDYFKDATALSQSLAAGDISSLELTEGYIQRIESLDDKTNAVVVRNFDQAREDARAIDEARARKAAVGPLAGLPVTVKESFNVTGLPTTWGAPWRRGHQADSDSAVVRRYREAGGVILGKSNVSFLLMDYQSINEVYGTSNNPWDLERTPGGSSGGSAAALAAGLTGLEAGSDIGGSLRNPAHYCGVYSLKPTQGVISSDGHTLSPVPMPPTDLAVVGPMARSARDLDLALDILAGPEGLKAQAWSLSLPKAEKTALNDYKVAVMSNHTAAPVDRSLVDKLSELAAHLEGLGVRVDDQARPELDLWEAHGLYSSLLFSVFAQDTPPGEIQAMRAAGEPAEDDYSGRAMTLRAWDLLHRGWGQLDRQRVTTQHLWRAFFGEWDVMLCPIGVNAANLHKLDSFETRTRTVNGEEQPFFQQSFWAGLATLADLPVVTVPLGQNQDGLPLGVQVIAAPFREREAIRFAHLLSEEIGGFQTPSGWS
ncbi:amidase [Rhodovibrionaceae bacterium A322]